jgi:integrase
MGRKSETGGVRAAGDARIQFTFKFEGIRYRPTLLRIPTEANLRRAREQLTAMKARIATGTFSFAEEFPDYLHLSKVPRAGSPRTCDQVFDDFLAHCAARVAKNDMATVTFTSYRRVLAGIWRPQLGARRFLEVRYSTLVEIADRADWSKKSYNNAISILRRAFKFGHRDHPELHDPTRQIKGARIQRKDRPIIDPFTIHEAEVLIAALHCDWGSAQGNYDEFRFFTGLRPSEQIALEIYDFDGARGTLCVTKARVDGNDKDATKTGDDRKIALSPRAIAVLKRQLALRARLKRAGHIDHDHLFFKTSGEPIRNLQYPYARWRKTLARLSTVRYRKPYCARHSSVSWDLMTGRSALWVARQHGHSIATMLRFYAAWTDGALETDIEAIRAAMASERPAGRQTTLPTRRFRKSRPMVRAFEVESAPSITVAAPPFASGYASGHGRPTAKCSKPLRLNWRRERDSNPRWAFDPYTLSRGAPSTTRPSLRRSINLSRQRPSGAIYHLSGSSAHEAGCGPLRRPGRILAATR